MKRTIAIMLYFLFVFPFILLAQQSNQGVYLSAADFNKGKISYSKKQDEKYKIYLHELFKVSTIKIIIDDSKIILNKDSIFGYRDSENNSYRFYNKEAYKILNPTEHILLYSKVSLSGNKGGQSIVSYFFSVDSYSSIHPLSIQNFKAAFPNDILFYELLDTHFANDKELLNYDNYRKTYKINYIYKLRQELITK